MSFYLTILSLFSDLWRHKGLVSTTYCMKIQNNSKKYIKFLPLKNDEFNIYVENSNFFYFKFLFLPKSEKKRKLKNVYSD